MRLTPYNRASPPGRIMRRRAIVYGVGTRELVQYPVTSVSGAGMPVNCEHRNQERSISTVRGSGRTAGGSDDDVTTYDAGWIKFSWGERRL